MEKPTEKRKEREKEARREAILAAAARVFSHKTYSEASLDEIAAEAELSKGTLYNYYNDKQDIFASLMQQGHQQFQERVDQVLTNVTTLYDLIMRFLEASLDILSENKYMMRMVLSAGGHLSENMRVQIMTRWQDNASVAADKLVKVFNNLPETENLPIKERRVGAFLIMSAIHSVHHRHLTSENLDFSKSDMDDYARLLCRALTVETTT